MNKEYLGYADLLDTVEDIKDSAQKSYVKGLQDAWDIVVNLCNNDDGIPISNLKNMFNSPYLTRKDCVYYICNKGYSIKAVIQKIKEYKENLFKVGDVVINNCNECMGVVTKVSNNKIYVLYNDGTHNICECATDFRKTGKHFSQIEEILNAMQLMEG